jgi:hypothetical protein
MSQSTSYASALGDQNSIFAWYSTSVTTTYQPNHISTSLLKIIPHLKKNPKERTYSQLARLGNVGEMSNRRKTEHKVATEPALPKIASVELVIV